MSAALAAWLEWRFPPESRFDREAPLFAHLATGLPYRDATLAKIWRRACQEAGVPYVSPYAASKHTTYSELARAGWDPLALQRMGRHSDPKTTLGYIEEFGPSRGETQRAREELDERQRREDRVVPLRRERWRRTGRSATSQQQGFGAATARNHWQALVGVVGFEPTTRNPQSSGSSR